jgi:dTDP-glucose pyrophosphorylase
MKNWQQVLIGPATSLREALETIDRAGSRMVVVVDDERRLLGTLSDGDVRRGLLRGLTLASAASEAMHVGSTTAQAHDDRPAILAKMRRLSLFQIPIVDERGVVVGLETVDDFLATPARENWVVIMAGGRGARLAELTRDTPKPMLKVGSRPLLETVLSNLSGQGFRRFFFAVNYKADQIMSHFDDGSPFGVEIEYLREEQPLGTAGALSLLPQAPSLPIIVTNGDILTKENCGYMLDKHVESRADATMAVRNYDMQVPFGVVREGDGGIEAIDEKPIQRFVVSAGIYVLSPHVLSLVPSGQFFDMPALFETMIKSSLSTRCHYVDGYWLDVGRVSDYERANMEFSEVFR